jgi:hypothetical protein
VLRILVCSTLFAALVSPALADVKDDAIAACAKILKRDGIAINIKGDYHAAGSGERYDVSVHATVSGRDNATVVCKTNKGRVTHINYG